MVYQLQGLELMRFVSTKQDTRWVVSWLAVTLSSIQTECNISYLPILGAFQRF